MNPRLRLLVLGLWALLLASASVSRAGEIEVEDMRTWVRDATYMLDAHIDYRFSDAALEAFDNGVPLHLAVQVDIRRDGAWFWERPLLDRTFSLMIRFLPLSELYRVVDQASGSEQSFATRGAAIAALGDLSGLPLVTQDAPEPGERYVVRLRASLDIGALPLPLRPIAYLSPAWQLSSDWKSWPLQP